MLFHEIYSTYFQTVAKILAELVLVKSMRINKVEKLGKEISRDHVK